MKIFNYTDGRKGKLLDNIKLAGSLRGWLRSEGDNVYRISVAAPAARDTEWSWHSGATYLAYVSDDDYEEVEITPDSYGVEAICFCMGQMGRGGDWQWVVIGTDDWTEAAIERGILIKTFSHTFTHADRVARAAEDFKLYRHPSDDTEKLAEMAARFSVTPAEILAALPAANINHLN